MTRLEEMTCIVTGTAKGIDNANCMRLAEEGVKMAVTDLDDDDGAALRDEIAQNVGTAEYWHLDVTDEDEVVPVFGEVAENFGQIDVVVENAGISGADKPTDEITSEEWRKVMDVNVNCVFYCTKAAIPHMRTASGDSTINLSSIYDIIGAPDIPPYHASKGAVREMSKTDALHFAKDGIRVNSVYSGFIWTPLVEAKDAFRKNLESLHPIGHVGEPTDSAARIAYLASDDAKFVTGSKLVIDGGYTAK